MKNLILFFLVLSFAANGQETETPNRFILGGNLSIFNNTQIIPEQEINTSSSATFTQLESRSNFFFTSISPYFGLQINQRSLVGALLTAGYSLTTTNIVDDDEFDIKRSSFTYGGGLFYRHNFNPNNKLKVFAQPFVNYSVSETNIEQSAPAFEEARSVSINLGIGLGATYSISERWNLLINIWNARYARTNSRTATQPESQITSTISANFSIQNIGFGAELSF